MSQARDSAITDILRDVQEALPGSSAALVSRSGALFAGKVPAAVHTEGYAAMMAVMHGAAETGTADLGDALVLVEARFKAGALVALPAGKKMLFVVHAADAAALESARPRLQDAADKLAALF